MAEIDEDITLTPEGGTHEAKLLRPAGPTRAFALIVHASAPEAASDALTPETRIARALAQRGIASLRLSVTSAAAVTGVLEAADYLWSEHGAPELLIGHGEACAGLLEASVELRESKALVLLGAACPAGSLGQLTSTCAALPPGRAFLMLHAEGDERAPFAAAERLYAAAPGPKSFVALGHVDHALGQPADARYVAESIALFASRYVSPLDEVELEPRMVVVEGGARGFVQRIRAGENELVADEPISVGGTGQGPDPYALLIAALGACTSMTLRMYADRRGLPLEGVEVSLEHERVYATDCEECEYESGRVDHIKRTIVVRGPLDDAARAKLLEIADKCPVHKTLHGQVHVSSRITAE
jgi:putative redox protein